MGLLLAVLLMTTFQDVPSGFPTTEVTSDRLQATVYLPGLSNVLQTRAPQVTGWTLALGLSAVPFAVGQILRLVQRRRG